MKNYNIKSYCMNSNNTKWNNIMKDYLNDVTLCFTTETTPYCLYEIGNIYFTYEKYKNPTERDLFDLLHEIGHIKTNKTGMKRCMEEYLATQWALDHAKKYKVKVTKGLINIFQKYIWDWRETGIKHKGKNMPTKEQLTLHY